MMFRPEYLECFLKALILERARVWANIFIGFVYQKWLNKRLNCFINNENRSFGVERPYSVDPFCIQTTTLWKKEMVQVEGPSLTKPPGWLRDYLLIYVVSVMEGITISSPSSVAQARTRNFDLWWWHLPKVPIRDIPSELSIIICFKCIVSNIH